MMKTIQMTLDEELVKRVDNVVKSMHTTRSAFTREALRAAIEKHNIRKLEEKQQQGYKRHPIQTEEFSVWENEQEWGDL